MAASSTVASLIKNLGTFHKLDSCKDALAPPGVLNNPPYSDPKLFKICMQRIYGGDGNWPCGGFDGQLAKIEEEQDRRLRNELNYDNKIVIKQINRLNYPASYGQNPIDTKLPISIEKAIRDSGRGPKEFKKDITILYNPSDFTDKSPRTSYDERKEDEHYEIYPDRGEVFELTSEVFEKLGVSIIEHFSATIGSGPNKNCKVAFDLFIPRIGDIKYSAVFDSNLKAIPGEIAIQGTECAAEFFCGNPIKNTWFNAHKADISNEAIKKGICYILCKEFFGDIMIALFSLYYKVHESIEASKTAIFTADNALTAVCKAWELNFISKNWKQTSQTQECVAVLYNTDKKDELIKNKRKAVDNVKLLNNLIIQNLDIITETGEGKDIKDIGKLNIFHKRFLEKMKRLIEETNENLDTSTQAGGIHDVTNEMESLVVFEKHIKLYKVANFIRSSAPNILFARSISNPFKFVPGLERILIKGEFVVNLQKLKSFDALLKGVEGIYTPAEIDVLRGLEELSSVRVNGPPIVLGRVRKPKQWGGLRKQGGGGFDFETDFPIPNERNAEKIYNLLEDPEILFQYQELYPTETLFTIIRKYIEEEYVEDIYNHLHFLFDINCVISYNLNVLKILISDLSQPIIVNNDVRNLNIEQWNLYYMNLIQKKQAPSSKRIPQYSSKSVQQQRSSTSPKRPRNIYPSPPPLPVPSSELPKGIPRPAPVRVTPPPPTTTIQAPSNSFSTPRRVKLGETHTKFSPGSGQTMKKGKRNINKESNSTNSSIVGPGPQPLTISKPNIHNEDIYTQSLLRSNLFSPIGKRRSPNVRNRPAAPPIFSPLQFAGVRKNKTQKVKKSRRKLTRRTRK